MGRRSAGLLLHRRRPDDGRLEVLLLHFGGPLWASRQQGAWTVPKGVVDEGEDEPAAARREFAEETGSTVPDGHWTDLGDVRQSDKTTRLWALEADFDPSSLRSNTFEMQWPPRSGQVASFPEVDRAVWATVDEARSMLVRSLEPFLDRLIEALRDR